MNNAAAGEAPILVNHAGLVPGAGKYCVVRGREPADFEVVDAATQKPAFKGRLSAIQGDFGAFLIGDFSALKTAGTYEVRTAKSRSPSFRIAPDVYADAIKSAVRYFSVQRCGASKTGWHAPCHTDDGKRLDNGVHQDVSGGWHDACDLRKWVVATIYGMLGLAAAAETLKSEQDQARIIEELWWGNQYFLKMQEPAGYLMNYCGGDDGNGWTDNTVGADDRPIHTEPCDASAQFQFIAAQCAVIRLTRKTDAAYAATCQAAAQRCLDWCVKENVCKNPVHFGAALQACAALHKILGGDPRYGKLAAGYARSLQALQIAEPLDKGDPVRGVFRSATGDPKPYRDIVLNHSAFLGLCAILETFPNHPDAPSWKASLAMYARNYLVAMAGRTGFGIVPFGFYADTDPGGGRRIGQLWYRWFMKPGGDGRNPSYDAWWVGINANLASAGVGLLKASRILDDPALACLAQRQLDWILGVNPFDASTMEGVGRNQPALFKTPAFSPPTPPIPGAVMCGIGGTEADQPDLRPGSWMTCEYWTPMVCFTMWLMSEISAPAR